MHQRVQAIDFKILFYLNKAGQMHGIFMEAEEMRGAMAVRPSRRYGTRQPPADAPDPLRCGWGCTPPIPLSAGTSRYASAFLF